MHGTGVGMGLMFVEVSNVGSLFDVIMLPHGDTLLIPVEIEIDFYGVIIDAGSGDITYSSSGVLPDFSLHIP